MKANRMISAFLAGLLALTIPLNTAVSDTAVVEEPGRRELIISDETGLAELSRSCRIDSYSENLHVTLSSDISLSGKFTAIPYFKGTFDGNGHTISGLNITDDGSYSGLFRYVGRGGLVKNLTVRGTVSPKGSAEYIGGIAGSNSGSIIGCTFAGAVKGADHIGGIAGINEESGFISNCKSSGMISGEHSSGGIVGSSSGVILNCESRCSVNTDASDVKLSLDDINWDSIISSEEPASTTDAGGIAGFSDGIIQGCENYGKIGYPHIGYNIGGIVGRQSGYLCGCINRGEVFGRKDVGGIAGQLEPSRSIEFDEDTVQKLADEMDIIGGLIDELIADAKSGGSAVNDKVQTLSWQMEQLRKSADDISDRAEDIFNGWTDGINEISARADIALDGLSPALDGLREGLDLLSQFSESLEEVFDGISASNDDIQDAVDGAKEGIASLNKSIDEISAAITDLSDAAKQLSEAMGDTECVEDAVRSMIEALDKINGEVGSIASALTKIGNSCKKLQQWVEGDDFKDLSDGISALTDSLRDVSGALSKMSSALQKAVGAADSDEMQKGLDELNEAAAELSEAASHAAEALRAASGTIPDADKASDELKQAADALTQAADKLTSAMTSISGAINTEQLGEGLDEMETASEELSSALADAEKAIGDISDAYDRISTSNVPENTLDEISKQFDVINASIGKITSAAEDINSALNEIDEQIDLDALKESFASISNALKKLSDAVSEISSSEESFDRAADSIASAMDTLSKASQSASSASAILAQTCDKFSEAAGQLADTTKILGDKPAVEFPAADEKFTAAVDSFSSNFSSISSTVSSISSTAKAQGDILLDDLQAINDELGNVTDILREFKDRLVNGDDDSESFTVDVSEDGSDTRQGRAESCVNYGSVQGDLNVGGVVGLMAIDYDFDPEDDIAYSGEKSLSFSYKIRDAADGCSNYGEITAKKNYCGGIVGRMDMGAVTNSSENGKITITDGNYAGGIAGYSTAAIRNCTAKVSISANSYVGGIAGQGLILTDNAAILEASNCKERCGAVSGYVDFTDENVEVLRNCFVDRGAAGIDGISYAGAAVPIDFEEFARLTGSEAKIEVSFVVDGEVINTVKVDYGAALSPEDMPEIPQKVGCFAQWSEFDNDCITFPAEVEAIYFPYVTVIESIQKSEENFPLVLADGIFTDKSIISVSTESGSIFVPDSGCELRLIEIEYPPADGAVTQLRFLSPQGKGTPNVMRYVNGAWKDVEFTRSGSYLIVDNPSLENGVGSFCVQLKRNEFVPVIVIAGCCVVAVVGVILLAMIIRRKRAAQKAASVSNASKGKEKTSSK